MSTIAEVYAAGPEARELLRQRLGDELPPSAAARQIEIEKALAEHLPETDPAERRRWAGQLAITIETDRWFKRVAAGTTPARSKADLERAVRDLRRAQRTLQTLSPAARASMNLRLLDLDAPSKVAAQRAWFLSEVVGMSDAAAGEGLAARHAALAQLIWAATEAAESWQQTRSGKARANRLARHVANAYQGLTGRPAPTSGTGEGSFYRLLEHVLTSSGIDDASPADLGRREVARRAAPHSGKIERKK